MFTHIKMQLIMFMGIVFVSCTSVPKFTDTVNNVDIQKYMGRWYVIEARPTFLEKNAYNSIEDYTWNAKENRIDIDFNFTKGSLNGPLKHIHQKGWIYNTKTNAHWKISPFWPFKFDYLIIALDADYNWTVVGVPNTNYLWIMSRTPSMSMEQLNSIKDQIRKLGYPLNDMKPMEHNLL